MRYDLPAVAKAVDRDEIVRRPPDLWRWRELLPVSNPASIVTLGEQVTHCCHARAWGPSWALSDLWIKDDGHLPTGSFKSRGQTVAISMAHELGIRRVAIPTAGNAGDAMAAYAARAGMEAYVFMPVDAPTINQFSAALSGARVFLVDGFITDCGKIVRAGKEPMGWFDISTLKEPYRIEGKKTMGLEMAEQFGWELPDVIFYPTGGGTGLIGMWKAFNELLALGWLNTAKLPRMVSVQSNGCAPIVRAFEAGKRFADPIENPATIASGIRVPAAVGDFMILDAIRESNGTAIAVDEERILEWMRLAVSSEGISVCPESATCVGAAETLLESGWLDPDDRIVIYNCAAAQKYADVMPPTLPLINKNVTIDWEMIAGGVTAIS